MKSQKMISLPVELIEKLRGLNVSELITKLLEGYFKQTEAPKVLTEEEKEKVEKEEREAKLKIDVEVHANENKEEYKKGWFENLWGSPEEFYIKKHLPQK